MLLSGYGIHKSPDAVIAEIPTRVHPHTNEPLGTLLTDHALYLMKHGFETYMYSFDVQVTDMSWKGLTSEQLLEKFASIKPRLHVPALGKVITGVYIEGYCDYLEAGGTLSILQHPSEELLKAAIQHGPALTSVCYQVLYGTSKIRFIEQGSVADEAGQAINHTIVINDFKDGSFEVYDPQHERRIMWIKSEDLLAGIMASQIECDNQLLVVKKAS